ncbi:iron chelate uptake ABC transporter family permease subunit [Mycoplasma suis]|uniref:ABC transporter, fecCD family n=1 Tax=Mycoplasma suis (strain Illinois) TaxID=768700 RepID=F0QQZ3_MYCSL|nr:iron chelate uptake ABC transporter family permease subunit [Mycoplasma suis]ADX97913.1 ABC transporter, fecCD family [Mycoplasma suis str. Illinois]
MYRNIYAYYSFPTKILEKNNKTEKWNVFKYLFNRKWLIGFGLVLVTLGLLVFNLSQQFQNSWDTEEVLAPFFGVRPKFQEQSQQLESAGSWAGYQKVVWICLASILAAILLSLSGNVSQSLLQNPLADCSTLGMIDAAGFGLMILKTILGASTGNYYWAYFASAFFCAFLVFALILFLFNRETAWERTNTCTMIILFGLVLNIFFRTSVHLIKEHSATSVNVAYALAMGGAENIYEMFPSQYTLLRWAIPIVVVLFIVTRLLSKNWNLTELGFDQAHSLGVNIKLLQFIGYSIILCCNTLTINLVGNISFIGLISTHLARKLYRTRKYETIIPVSAIIAVTLIMVAVTVNQLVPAISSSNLILALGALSLLLLTKE